MADQYNELASAARTVAQGATFGFGDEIEAGIRSLMSERPYEEIRDELRGDIKRFSDENPGTALGLELAGGFLVPGFGAAKGLATAGKTLAQRAGQSLAVGAGSGALAGVGASESSDALGVASDAGKGLVFGGALGGVAPIAGDAAGRIARRGLNMLGVGADAFKDRKISEALDRVGMTPGQAARELRVARKQGVEDYTIADLGRQTQDLTYAANAVPNRGQNKAGEFLGERYETQAGNISDKVAEAMDTHASTVTSYIDDLVQAQSQLARQQYPEAYKKALNAVPFREFFKNEAFRGVVDDARKLQNIKNLADGSKISIPDIESMSRAQFIPTEVLHSVKIGLDAIVEGERDSITKRLSPKGRAYSQVLVKFNNLIKNMNEDYRLANAQYSDRAGLRASYEMGEAFHKAPVKELQKELAGYKLSENYGRLEAFRAGLVNRVIERAGSVADSADFTKEVFGSPRKREILRMAFPSKSAYEDFEAFIKRQRSMVRTNRNVTGGSPTASRQIGLEGAGVDPGAILDVATGNVGGAMRSASQKYLSRAGGMSEKSAEGLLEDMLQTDPKKQIEILRRIRDMQQKPTTAYSNPGAYAAGLGTFGGLLSSK